MMWELIYNSECIPVIRARYPNAKITDASDFIHVGRFELEIDDVIEDDFYPFAIQEGFALDCLAFQVLMRKDKDSLAQCKRWVEMAGLGAKLEDAPTEEVTHGD